MASFAVITPTIGSKYLAQCIKSVRGQDCTHYIVMDGRENFQKINKILVEETGINQQIKLITLDNNVGKGWYGHRVYAASSFLVNEDYLCYLDEDNWVEPNYIEAFGSVINKHEWVYTLRNVVDHDGSFVCQDNCESLGKWEVFMNGGRYHIDTGCFAVPRSIAVRVGHNWYGQWGADRQFFAALKQAFPKFGCTEKYTLNYRLGSETSSATKQMFLQGNEIIKQHYQGEYPWIGKTPIVKHPTNPTILKFNTETNQFSC